MKQACVSIKFPTRKVPNELHLTPAKFRNSVCTGLSLIEGFGGKRAVGILRKIELCQKHSKFRMQFCLGVLNNVLHVFSLKLASFSEILRMQKNTFFRGHPLGTFC